jgi:hypothetical protein
MIAAKTYPLPRLFCLCCLSLFQSQCDLLAAETAALTLSCDGTTTNIMADSDKPESITKMGLLVNLREGSVLGFAYPARIKTSDAVSVEFYGGWENWSVRGTIDRITGSVEATTLTLHPKTKDIATGYRWDLHCIPTKRVF